MRHQAPIRVHGPYQHRSQWRLDVFKRGARSKLSFATYSEALLAAHSITTGVETSPVAQVSVDPNGNPDPGKSP